MRDELDARIWGDHGAAFAAALDRFFSSVALSLKRLHEIHFSAPWQDRRLNGPGQA